MRTAAVVIASLVVAACGGGDDALEPDGGGGAVDAAAGDAAIDAPLRPGLSIVFDYRFDDAGFFTPARRLVLEAAARRWGDAFGDEFPDIPAGTSVRTRDPEAPTAASTVFDLAAPIEDVLVFVGCSAIDGQGGVTATSNHSAALGTVVDPVLREQLRSRYEGPVFEPWTAWISFDCGEAWFFDATPDTDTDLPGGQHDFLSVAMHEVGHILGFGTAMGFLAQVNATPAFTGAAAVAAHQGPVPMGPGGTHFVSGLSSDGREPLMDPGRSAGMRTPPTTLDRAAMFDIGYEPR